MNITVVVPTYKRPTLLMECLKALANQHFDKEGFEIMVVSDGSDMLTRNVVASWEQTSLLNVYYLALPEKRGPAAARNLGWKSGSGSLVAFTDDDCIPDVNWLPNLWQSYVGGEVAITGRVMVPLSGTPTDHESNTAHLETADFITANCAISRSALQRIGGFDEAYTMAWREDSDMEFKLLQAGTPICKQPAAIVVHPVRKAAWGSSLRDQRKTMFNALLYKKFPGLYRRKIGQRPPAFYYSMVFAALLSLAFYASGQVLPGHVMFGFWMVQWLLFSIQRLSNTSRRPQHVLEMLVTSALIPFLSIYWSWYGAYRYKVLYI
ncbi:glycosyltransferase [Chitinophaga horti]|uniref:Glycosyltransferase n=1 Tax=Chitinophaga horti TaxID=2920382 RepID=A0ABY6J7G2_9BACT|nr:glycosyltransferase [Chitinophaga horti]UYQ94089.1 glycosyltransferase [Chitinophaga horti]